MTLDKLGRYVFIGGTVIVFLSSIVMGIEWVSSRYYKSENTEVFHALGRELSGDNARAREHHKSMQTIGAFTFGTGVLGMAAGGAMVYAARKGVRIDITSAR